MFSSLRPTTNIATILRPAWSCTYLAALCLSGTLTGPRFILTEILDLEGRTVDQQTTAMLVNINPLRSCAEAAPSEYEENSSKGLKTLPDGMINTDIKGSKTLSRPLPSPDQNNTAYVLPRT